MRRTSTRAQRVCIAAGLWVAGIWSAGLVRGAEAAPAIAVRSLVVDGQPLAANVDRLLTALDFLGAPMEPAVKRPVEQAVASRDARALQTALDPQVLFVVSINPELRVKVARGPGAARLQQQGFTPALVKVINEGTVTGPLNSHSPQAGAVYAGASDGSLRRQQQTELNRDQNTGRSATRFLSIEVFRDPPMTPRLSGLPVEYVLVLLSSEESGPREATIAFDIGQGTGDIGFRGEVPVLFDVAAATPVTLAIHDDDGLPTTAKLTIRDAAGRVYPSQAKRLAPDFFFQPHIYRKDGDVIHLPPGEFTVTSSRGPEYALQSQALLVPDAASQFVQGREADRPLTASSPGTGAEQTPPGTPATIDIALRRWIDPSAYGFYSGDHHIHGAGCAHYQSPTEGVSPADMFQQVKGEGLNVGCVLTWGPCFDFQRRYFSPVADEVSEPLTLLKYDLEISGFGSAPMGHVCLLNLTDQTYPGTNGTIDGWPTWTVPVLRWAKEQGGVTGFPHSAMGTEPKAAAQRLLARWDRSRDGRLSIDEAHEALLTEPFDRTDESRDGLLDAVELTAAAGRAADRLPNLIVPEMTGGGAMEIVVAVPEGVCDFISAMDTERIGEWNTWYHLLNCGFPLKVSGETDFPCMSSRRVGQGRVYVQLGDLDAVDFTAWCTGLAAGQSYVSDGYAHALRFEVSGQSPGVADVQLPAPQSVQVTATVSFAEEVPEGVAYGTADAPQGLRVAGDTRELHVARSGRLVRPGRRLVEIVMNGESVARQEVPADGAPHDVSFTVDVRQSSWIALRQFPQLHTNPVNVLIGGRPIRASRDSARWCEAAVDVLWEQRSRLIAAAERPAAEQAYERAKAVYRDIQQASR